MPALGLGVFEVPPGEITRRAVEKALQVGYRLIDTAAYYGNEADVGEAVRGSGLDRSEVFLTSKVWLDDQGYDRTLRAFDRTMAKNTVTISHEPVEIALLALPPAP